MITTPIITRAEIQQYKQLSNSINNDKLNELILQAQMVDLLPLMGERLYYHLLDNLIDYNDLLNGLTYDYNGITYTNVGLKAVLAHYVYARYAMFGDIIDTAFGLKAKINNDVSERIDTSYKKTLYENNCNYAFNLWLNVEHYLIRTNNELYKCSGIFKPKNFKMSRIG